MRPASTPGRINIAASARKVDVDNRISLRFYYRIADNILKQVTFLSMMLSDDAYQDLTCSRNDLTFALPKNQDFCASAISRHQIHTYADIFRGEKNIIDLYIMLIRFSSLVQETIPCHRDYRASTQSKRIYLKKKLLNAVAELEVLKPAVQQKIDELNRKHTHQVNGWSSAHRNGSLECPPAKKKTSTGYDQINTVKPAAQLSYQGSRTQQFAQDRPGEEQFQRISLNFLRPKEETLSKHSILGPNGLHGQWQPPRTDIRVCYPRNIDLTPIDIPCLNTGVTVKINSSNSGPHNLLQSTENGFAVKSNSTSSETKKSSFESILTESEDSKKSSAEELASLIFFETIETSAQPDLIRQPSPPSVLAEVQDLIPAMSTLVAEAEQKVDVSSSDELIRSESPLQLHISTSMMENFMKLAKSNTDKNLETCGILAGSLKNRKFYITALIIPKQESTSNSCQATNEEEIFEVQEKRSLFPLGWIHTHPTQSCFMSSIDVHTHYSYQIMLPEAVAIVMAPRDTSRKHGIFRLTNPGGLSVIRQCQQRGFHAHDQPPGGGPIYSTCTDVYMNPNLKFDVIDLR